MKKSIPIGQLLLSTGHITKKQLDRALEVQKKMPDKRIGDILIELDYVSEENMLKSLSKRVNSPLLDLKSYAVDVNALNTLNESYARKNRVVPIDFQSGHLVVVTNDPLNFYVLDEIQVLTGYPVKTMLAPKKEIELAIDKYYSESVVKSAVDNINRTFNKDESNELTAMGIRIEGAPTVTIVNTIIYQASLRGASDIHIEPFKNNLLVRIRIDGDLIEHTNMNIGAHNSIVTRLKLLGGMNIAEKRLPQDGGFHFDFNEVHTDIRISTLPTIFGEKVVMRLLNIANKTAFNINQIGIDKSRLEKLKKMLKIPNGILLVTGPTGSGKTTTLYAMLNELIKKSINIVTIEDPVERPVEGINQVQINVKAGMTFSSALRSILRQDPDIIMIGEIRDRETAEIGVRASITGHLVLGSIHTNDSASTIARLIDMGIEPYMVGASLSGIISQRLVKKLCPYCKQKYSLSENEKILMEGRTDELYRPVGCERCDYTGYMGRTGIYEVVEGDVRLREMIVKSAGIHEIKEYERAKGVVFLKESVIQMALDGETSLSEVEKINYSVE